MNQKEIAIQCLKKLDIYKPYIRKFEKEDMPTFFERCAGYYLFNEPVLQDKVKKVQELHDRKYDEGANPPKLLVIDATKKESASKA